MNKHWKYLGIVFFVGVCVTALEIASARLISPYFGSTIYVWGGAIGTALFALAIGYWLGGMVIDRYPSPKPLALILLCAAISTMVIPWMYQTTTYSLSHWSALQHIPVSLAVMLSMLVLFFIPILALGMVSPMVLKLTMTSVERLGSWSGLLSGVATFGSIVGTFLASYATIPLLGTRWTIYMAGALLFILSAIVSIPRKRMSVLSAVLLASTAMQIAGVPFVARVGVAAEKESAYQLVQVIKQKDTRYLVHDAAHGVQSLYTPGTSYTKSPYDVFGLLPYLIESKEKKLSVLLLGLGGGNIVRLFEEHLGNQFSFDITAVEIDPVVVQMAKQYFDLDQLDVKIVIDDARHFLRNDKNSYDIVVIDAYTHETQIPVMLATQEFFQQVQSRLQPGGVLGINAFAFRESRFLPKFLNTLSSVFPDVREATFTPDSLNHFVVAGESINPELVPKKLDSVLQQYRDSALVRLTKVSGGSDIYTDDRSDLDIRVKPFLQ